MKAKWYWLLLVLVVTLTLGLAQACAVGDDNDDDLDIDDDDAADDDDDAADDDDDDDAADDDDDDDTGDDDTGDDDTGDDDTGDDDTGDDDTGDDDTGDDDTAVDDTIYDVQNGTIPEGTIVTLADVVVTAAGNTNGFWIQEPLDGKVPYTHEYSGVYVYLSLLVGKAVSVNRGDVVTVTGEVDEFSNMTEIKVTSEDDVTVTGSGASLPSAYINTTDFFGGWEAADPEPYEGVLVKVTNVTVTLNAGSGVYWIAQISKLDEGTVRVDDWYYDLAASADDQYYYIQGPLYQGGDAGGHVNYRLQPRLADDVSQIPPK